MPARPDGAPLRDGDTKPYPGWPRNADLVRDAPGWVSEPTQLLSTATPVRPYLFAPKIQQPKSWP